MTLRDVYDKLDLIAVLGFLIAVETQITNGSMSLAHTVPEAWIPIVKEWAANLASIGGLLVGIFRMSTNGGSSSTAATIVKVVIAAFALSLLFSGAPAFAGSGPLVQHRLWIALTIAIWLGVFAVTLGTVWVARSAFQRVRRALSTPVVIRILLAAFTLSLLFPGGEARAQSAKLKTLPEIKRDIDTALGNGASKSAKADASTDDPTAALPCMDITMLKKLTFQNLKPTMEACKGQLVEDTQRALDSATNYTPTGAKAPTGDNDAVNCLTPALALFKAGVIVPAVPAVLNDDGSVKVAAVPEQKPGPILLAQKYREFTLSGGLTSCQNWIDQPANATLSAAGKGVAGAAGLGTAALAVLPK